MMLTVLVVAAMVEVVIVPPVAGRLPIDLTVELVVVVAVVDTGRLL